MAGRFTIEAIFNGVDRLTGPVRRMGRGISKFSKSAVRNLKAIDKQVTNIGKGFLSLGKKALVGFALVGGAIAFVMNEFSKVENAEAAFQPLLGSIEKARVLVDKLNKTAATTPFRFEPLAQSAKILIAMGAAGEENVIPMLRMLGDLAGGSAENLQRMAINFAEISANGQAMTRDLRQFTTAGVPLIRELSKILGVTTAQIQDMASKGKISFELIQQALKNMTGEGGKFFKGMEIASKTFSGRLSTMRDRISLVAVAIGKELAPEMKGLVEEVIAVTGEALEWVKANKELIGQKFKEMVQGVRAFFIFLVNNGPILLSIAKWTLIFVGSLKALTLAMGTVTLSTQLATGAMKAFRFVALLNPMTLAAVALGVAVGLILLKWNEIHEAMLRVFGLSKQQDEEKAALTRAQGVNPSDNILANLSDEERDRLSDQDRAIFGLPPKSESVSSATVTIRDESNRAEITQSSTSGAGAGISLIHSGDF